MDIKNERPFLSVVTVTYNCEDCLESTIKSVVSQSFKGIEYLIIDGGSKDRTLEIAKSYLGKGLDVLVSEPDNGIYDAMNKGVARARGHWVLFLNAGDYLVSEKIIEQVFDSEIPCDTEVLYGNHILLYADGREKVIVAGHEEKLWKGSQFCHQSVFVRHSRLANCVFNIKRTLAADYEFFLNAWRSGAKFQFVDEVVVKYKKGGVSDVNRIAVIKEWESIAGPKYRLWYKFLLIRTRMTMSIKICLGFFGLNRWQ